MQAIPDASSAAATGAWSFLPELDAPLLLLPLSCSSSCSKAYYMMSHFISTTLVVAVSHSFTTCKQQRQAPNTLFECSLSPIDLVTRNNAHQVSPVCCHKLTVFNPKCLALRAVTPSLGFMCSSIDLYHWHACKESERSRRCKPYLHAVKS